MTDYTELKRLAEAATPGRNYDRLPESGGGLKYECTSDDGSLVLKVDHKNDEWGFVGDRGEQDEAFFLACTPSAILALIAENERLRADNNTVECRLEVSEDTLACIRGCLRSAETDIDQLKAEVEALRKQVADLSPFKGAPLTGPDTRCLACGGYHYGLGNLPCPKMRAIACAETYMANQRIVPVEPMIAGPHPLDAAMSKEAGHD